MASRYLVATGNWSSTSVWSATSGGASGASVPISGDLVRVEGGYTVTMTSNGACTALYITNGTFNLSSYTFTTGMINNHFTGSDVGAINLGSGTVNMDGSAASSSLSLLSNSVTFNAGTSVINISSNYTGGALSIFTGGYTFNDVVLNMGTGTVSSQTVNLSGSPTFRSLIIQSKNSAAHTVNFDASATVTVNTTFTGLGTSTGNISLLSATSGTAFNIASSGTTTSDYLTVQDSHATGSAWYAGAHSVNTSGNTGWIFAAAPIPPTLTGISTLTGVQSITF